MQLRGVWSPGRTVAVPWRWTDRYTAGGRGQGTARERVLRHRPASGQGDACGSVCLRRRQPARGRGGGGGAMVGSGCASMLKLARVQRDVYLPNTVGTLDLDGERHRAQYWDCSLHVGNFSRSGSSNLIVHRRREGRLRRANSPNRLLHTDRSATQRSRSHDAKRCKAMAFHLTCPA